MKHGGGLWVVPPALLAVACLRSRGQYAFDKVHRPDPAGLPSPAHARLSALRAGLTSGWLFRHGFALCLPLRLCTAQALRLHTFAPVGAGDDIPALYLAYAPVRLARATHPRGVCCGSVGCQGASAPRAVGWGRRVYPTVTHDSTRVYPCQHFFSFPCANHAQARAGVPAPPRARVTGQRFQFLPF